MNWGLNAPTLKGKKNEKIYKNDQNLLKQRLKNIQKKLNLLKQRTKNLQNQTKHNKTKNKKYTKPN